ncbi:uncharacterized protein isoform X2 [Rhodnius prolixus]|uniref:uncharacterized protein isoform X2 n=1 Tax=Rhodnius prolixus TaxID=13249 RepID=UPI003D187EEE
MRTNIYVLFAAMFLLEAIMCGTVKKRSSNDDEEEEKDEGNQDDLQNIFESVTKPFFSVIEIPGQFLEQAFQLLGLSEGQQRK